MGCAANLALYSATPLPDALKLPPGLVRDYFDSKAFADWRRGEEAKLKVESATVERLNMVIRGCNAICKQIAMSGRR